MTQEQSNTVRIGKTIKVRLVDNGTETEVYKLKDGNFCNAKDCTTKYSPKELQLIK